MKQCRTLLVLNISTFLMMLGVGLIVALLPRQLIDLSGSDSSIGWLAAAFAASFVLLQVPVGSLADRLGFRVFLTLGYGLAGLTGLVYYWAPNTLGLFLGRFLQGIAEIPIWALAPAILAIHHPSRSGRAIGMYNASMHLGLTLGPLIGLLLEKFLPGNAAFLFYTAVCLVGAIAVGRYVEEPNHATPTVPQSQSQQGKCGKGDRRLAVVLTGVFLYGAGYGVYLTGIPAYLILEKGFSQSGISLYFTLSYLGISLSQVLAGRLSDAYGRSLFMITGLLAAGICLAAFPNATPAWTMILLAIGSLGLGVFNVASLAYINRQAPDHKQGTSSGFYFLAWGLGYFIGPLGVGYLNHAWNVQGGFLTLAVLIVVNALPLAAMKGRSRKC